MADLPAFTGLGSSSAFTVALLHALHSFKGEFLNPHQLACEAIYLERHILRENVGCQDQIFAAFGGFNLVEFRTETEIEVKRVPLPPERLADFEQYLFLVFTGIKRKASDIAAQQLRKVADNTLVLRTIHGMVYRGYDILTGGRPLREFGELLDEAWQAKRRLDEGVSNPEIDQIYHIGKEAGAWGGKVLGVGGGGFMLLFAPPEAHPRLQKTFEGRQVLKVKLNAPG